MKLRLMALMMFGRSGAIQQMKMDNLTTMNDGKELRVTKMGRDKLLP